MRALAIINPLAGRRAAARVWDHLRRDVAPIRSWDCVTTEGPRHASELAARAARDGYERVVAVGGDGTVSEVADGLTQSGPELGIIPLGTGNDVAQNLGIPTSPAAAARLAATGQARPLDLGQIRGADSTTCFINVAGFGFDADVAVRVNRMPKVVGGTLPYVVGVLQTLWQYTAPRMRLTIDGQRLDRSVFLVAVGNCASYGGGMRIVPDARPDDGAFDVCVVNDLSRLEVVCLVPKLYSGGHVGHPAVEMYRCRSLTADADRRVLCQADGELVGGLPAEFSILPAALQCVTGPPAARPPRS